MQGGCARQPAMTGKEEMKLIYTEISSENGRKISDHFVDIELVKKFCFGWFVSFLLLPILHHDHLHLFP